MFAHPTNFVACVEEESTPSSGYKEDLQECIALLVSSILFLLDIELHDRSDTRVPHETSKKELY